MKKWLLLIFFGIVLLLGGLLNTTTGLYITARLLTYFTAGTLQVDNIQGSLLQGFAMQHLSYTNKTSQLAIKQLMVRWQWQALLKKKILIDNITVDGLVLQIQANTETTSTSSVASRLYFPWTIDLKQLLIKQVHIIDKANHELAYLQQLQVTAVLSNNNLYLDNDWQQLQINAVDKLSIKLPVGTVQLRGNVDDYRIHTQFQLAFSDKLQTLHGQGQARFANNQLIAAHLDLRNGSANAMADFVGTQQLSWQLNIPELGKLLPDSQGLIQSHGIVTQLNTIPRIYATVLLQHLQLLQTQLANLQAEAQLATNDEKKSYLKIQVNDIVYQQQHIKQVVVQLRGYLSQQVINAKIQTARQQLAFSLQGNIKQQTWFGQLNQFTFNNQAAQVIWQLKQPVKLTVNQKQFDMSQLCLSATANQQVCLQAHWQQHQAWSLQVNSSKFLLSNFQDVASNTYLQGVINLNLNLNSTHQKTVGKLQLNIMPGHIRVATNKSISYQTGNVTAELAEQGLQAQLNLNLNPRDYVKAEFNLPNLRLETFDHNQLITGHITAYLDNLNILNILLPSAYQAQGIFKANLQITGSVTKPDLNGTANLNLQTLNIPDLGIVLRNSHFSLQGNPAGKLTILGTLNSGSGNLHLQGITDLLADNMPTNLLLRGENFTMMNTTEYKINISPNLQVKATQDRLDLTGEVLVPSANIAIQDFSNTIEPSSDIVYVNQDQKIASPLQIFSQVRIRLGNSVHIAMLGLNAQLGGNVDISDAPSQLTLANGEFKILKGSYQAYGQTLTIQHGRVFFVGGPVENPGLDIQAVRTLNAVLPATNTMFMPEFNGTTKLTVGVNVQGNADDPQISLFAQPAVLSDADILSYLILGRPQSQASTADARLLLQALSALSPGGSSQLANITQQIQTTFGLDELSINSNQALDSKTNQAIETTALVLGKRLSPRLYLNYIVDLTSQNNILQLQYKLAKSWLLQTQTSTTDNGVDLFYTLQRK